jgi:hypothetical protein
VQPAVYGELPNELHQPAHAETVTLEQRTQQAHALIVLAAGAVLLIAAAWAINRRRAH